MRLITHKEISVQRKTWIWPEIDTWVMGGFSCVAVRSKETHCAELVTTRVLTDTPSQRLGHSGLGYPTDGHCNLITQKAPQLLQGCTIGSPCWGKINCICVSTNADISAKRHKTEDTEEKDEDKKKSLDTCTRRWRLTRGGRN